jgi:hypothetical protein
MRSGVVMILKIARWPTSGTIHPHVGNDIATRDRATLVRAIVRGRRWLDELNAGSSANVEAIAKREGCCSARKVNMTVSLAFLAPGAKAERYVCKHRLNPNGRTPSAPANTVMENMAPRAMKAPASTARGISSIVF